MPIILLYCTTVLYSNNNYDILRWYKQTVKHEAPVLYCIVRLLLCSHLSSPIFSVWFSLSLSADYWKWVVLALECLAY